ncbi:hypothetical protein AB3N60_04295 [Leptospira sp. WS39.C2]
MEGNFKEIFNQLDRKGYHVTDGLTDTEISKIENEYSISFNIDHLKYLKTGLVIGERFYNWRDFSENNIYKIKKMLNWPLEGILFDIKNNLFWYNKIGKKPEKLENQIAIFSDWYHLNVPKLIPIYSHRFMPSEPKRSGTPVYSVYQTDIIYYGEDIISYFNLEFSLNITKEVVMNEGENKEPYFWNDLAS